MVLAPWSLDSCGDPVDARRSQSWSPPLLADGPSRRCPHTFAFEVGRPTSETPSAPLALLLPDGITVPALAAKAAVPRCSGSGRPAWKELRAVGAWGAAGRSWLKNKSNQRWMRS